MKNFLIILALVGLTTSGVFAFYAFNRSTTNQKQEESGSKKLTPNYTDEEGWYELYIPGSFKAEKQSSFSTLFYHEEQPPGPGPTNFIYISVVTAEKRSTEGEVYNYSPKDYQKLIALNNVGEKVNLAVDGGQAEWFT